MFRRAIVAAFILVICVTPSISQTVFVGIYSDPTGKDCDLVLFPGVVDTMHVVITSATPVSLTGVRFAAPLPPCASGMLAIGMPLFPVTLGDIESGISIGFGACLTTPIVAMSILVLNGDASAGCEWRVLADPNEPTGEVVMTDCDFELIAGFGGSVIFRGCIDEILPPFDPIPFDGVTGVTLDADVSWTTYFPEFCVGQLGCVLRHEVSFGTDPNPPIVAYGHNTQVWDPGPLLPGTTYYWGVDPNFAFTGRPPGTIWSFTTEAAVPIKSTTWGAIKARHIRTEKDVSDE